MVGCVDAIARDTKQIKVWPESWPSHSPTIHMRENSRIKNNPYP